MAWVYILINRDHNKTYTGSTVDIKRRIREHNNKKSRYTKRFGPWMLLHKEEFCTIQEAKSKEKYYKTHAGRKKIKNIVDNINNPG